MKLIPAIVCCQLWAVLAVPGFAQTPSTIAYTSGAVRVNDHDVTRSQVIFSGDMIRTEAGTVNLSDPGFGVVLEEYTRAMLREGVLHIGCGRALVETTRGLPAQISHYQIKPANAQSRYSVRVQDGKLTIAALKGDLTITRGKESMKLRSGKELHAMEACHEADYLPPDDGTQLGQTVVGKFGGTYTSGAAVAAVGASGAAVITGVALSNSVSPVK